MKTISRREFIERSGKGILAAAAATAVPSIAGGTEKYKPVIAKYWKQLDGETIQCNLCPRLCTVAKGSRGFCRARENINGKYYTLVYSKAVALHNDPIEKKPFFHYLPGTKAFSIATACCNFTCKFCQNWEISQFKPEEVPWIYFPPSSVVRAARDKGSRAIAFTYNEPTIFYEYMYDTAKLARENGLGAVVVSNGFIREKPLTALVEYVDGYRVDLKSFREKFYSSMSNGRLKPVLETIERIKKKGVWLELIHLTIPTLNDSDKEMKEMAKWILGQLGPDVPLHITRFHPTYKLTNLPVTPVRTLERCREVALQQGLHFVYIGNVLGHPAENTYCPYCKGLLIRRIGFRVIENTLRDGKCPECDKPIAGKWK